jgi:hypothetical protein
MELSCGPPAMTARHTNDDTTQERGWGRRQPDPPSNVTPAPRQAAWQLERLVRQRLPWHDDRTLRPQVASTFSTGAIRIYNALVSPPRCEMGTTLQFSNETLPGK